jgi:glycosyltransferase involved in cell wall biosynthesis
VHVAQISFFMDAQARPPEQLLRDWPSLGDVAECVAGAGARVSVIQACHQAQQLVRGGVSYHFLPFGIRGRTGWHGALRELLGSLAPDVLHVHGLDFPSDVIALAATAPGVPILLQDHASGPPRFWRRALWRRAFAAASGIAFCAADQAYPFASAGLISAGSRVYAIPESSSHFVPGDGAAARRHCGLVGEPLLLWVGNLNSRKDPLTVLDAISLAACALPNLRLYCYFASAPLLGAVQRRIAKDPDLRGRVQLVGQVAHANVEQLMQAADFLVLGSHEEGSGYAVIEALACGLPPLVTDIASFRELSDSGRIGALWPVGDAAHLAGQLKRLASQPQHALRAAVRAHFEAELSFEAVGRKLCLAYQEMLDGSHARVR